MNIFIVIAAYNESKRIGSVIADLRAHGYTSIVVIDDCSGDDTGACAAAAGAAVISHPINRGQGAALETGMEFARRRGADIVIHFDGDGQMQASDIGRMIEPLRAGRADIVFGTRFAGDSGAVPWTKKWFILKPAILLNRFITGVPLTDAHNGFRALSKQAFERISLTHDRMAHATEIVAQTGEFRLRWEEVSVKIRYAEFGQGFSGGIRILWELIKGALN